MPQVYFDSSLYRVSFCPSCISFSKLASFRQCTKGLSSLNKLYSLGWLYSWFLFVGLVSIVIFIFASLYTFFGVSSDPPVNHWVFTCVHVLLFLPVSYQSFLYPLRAPRLTDSVLSLMLISSRPQSLLLSSFPVLTGSLWNQPEPLIIFLPSLLPRSASLQRACSGYCYCGSWYEIFQDLKANQRLLRVTLG